MAWKDITRQLLTFAVIMVAFVTTVSEESCPFVRVRSTRRIRKDSVVFRVRLKIAKMDRNVIKAPTNMVLKITSPPSLQFSSFRVDKKRNRPVTLKRSDEEIYLFNVLDHRVSRRRILFQFKGSSRTLPRFGIATYLSNGNITACYRPYIIIEHDDTTNTSDWSPDGYSLYAKFQQPLEEGRPSPVLRRLHAPNSTDIARDCYEYCSFTTEEPVPFYFQWAEVSKSCSCFGSHVTLIWESTSSVYRVIRKAKLGSLSQEQQLIADVWKLVDGMFFDRTFNGQPWLTVLQNSIRKDYASMEEAYNATRAMLDLLQDNYTRFLSPSEYMEFQVDTLEKEFAGVGVRMQNATIKTVLEGPAKKGGVKPGDIVLSVDGQSTENLTTEVIVQLLRGPPETNVCMDILSVANGVIQELCLVRQSVENPSVFASVEEFGGDKYGILKVDRFSTTTADLIERALKTFYENIRFIVLDLRGNAGGLLDSAKNVSSLFLPKSTIIYSEIDPFTSKIVRSDADGIEISKPILILVNKQSASASEIVSAALRENKRAKIVGERTFGKGVAQSVEEVTNGSAVKITTSKWLTPLGNDVNNEGIDVDIPSTCSESDSVLVCLKDYLESLNE